MKFLSTCREQVLAGLPARMPERRSGAWIRTRRRSRGSSRAFVTKYNRWNSPKFLFGESYGTTRSAVLANLLENEKNIDLNGVMLLGEIFNFPVGIGVGGGRPGVDLPFELALPTYAATAWYHKKLPTQPAALEPFLKEVEDFAHGRVYARVG